MLALVINYCYLNLEHLVFFVISKVPIAIGMRNLFIGLKLRDSSSHCFVGMTTTFLESYLNCAETFSAFLDSE